MNNDVITRDPVNRSSDPVLIARLQRINNAKHLGSIAASRSRVGKYKADGLCWVDDENGADGESDALLVNIGGVLVIQPSKSPPSVYREFEGDQLREDSHLHIVEV